MKTLNYKYIDEANLVEFIQNNSELNSANVLVQIFTGVCEVEFIQDLVSTVKSLITDVKIIGTTTSGEIMDANVYDRSTILAFSIFESTQIATHIQKSLDDSYDTANSLISKFDKTSRAKVLISFADGLNTNGEKYLNAFNNYDKELIVVGGLAGDNIKFTGTIVFTQEEVLRDGCVAALLYNDDLIAHTKAVLGWENIGKTLTITKAKENIVYEIDGIKVIDIYAKYLGKDIANELPKTGIEFPLIIKRDDLNIPRAVIRKNSDDSLVFAGNLNNGDKVTFGYGNVDSIISGGDITYNEMLQNPLESIFIYSCMARKALMGRSIALEIKSLSSISSLSGFFTYGEFFSDPKTLNKELLNQTMTILSLSENTNTVKITNNTKFVDRRGHNKTLKALSHLISQTTFELEEINDLLEFKVEKEVKKNREREQQLLEQSRMAQMGEMLSMIAHQWRQPLAAISSTSASLELKARLGRLKNEEILTGVKNISSYSQHLSATINDFRDFFKEQKNAINTSYNKIVKSVFEIIKISMENKNISLVQESNTDREFKTFSNELKQVILNLIKNAEDILVEKNVEFPCVKIITYSKDNSEVLEVHDNGGGVPENIIDNIFDPYFSTKLEKNGTGLGLYMSKTIIQEHCGGELSVSNNEYGAVFRIALNIKD